MTTHGETGSRLYKKWASMLDRCRNQSHPSYPWYGGKGIQVCNEWHKYEAFAKWARSNGYENNLTIDRVDNGKGYSPSNCRFTTKSENSKNGRIKKLRVPIPRPEAKVTEATNREITRFVNHVGGNTKAAKIMGCSVDAVRKLKTGLRGKKGIDPKYIQAMYLHKGFRLSFLRLHDLDWRPKE